MRFAPLGLATGLLVTFLLAPPPFPSASGPAQAFVTVGDPCRADDRETVAIRDAPTIGFYPEDLDVAVGTLVTWSHQGVIPHTTTQGEEWEEVPTGLWDSGEMNSLDTFTVLFCATGSYAYYCWYHPGAMTGTVDVA
jgi:plastocyanin